ncbi:MAG: hypothetical protein CVT49_07380 [candidate division Zixibacteria bacterium HGW-Zixibacteria-1]|nr:MAG: hypothetical protein CVT49_07380 [candidate division Zixibacteria bacterium HGW-Zixibacteria-1]
MIRRFQTRLPNFFMFFFFESCKHVKGLAIFNIEFTILYDTVRRYIIKYSSLFMGIASKINIHSVLREF